MAPDETSATTDPTEDPSRDPGTGGPADEGEGAAGAGSFDLRGVVRQLTAPMIESLDTRLRGQIEAHVDQLLDEKVDAALADRLQTIDRAIADLSRSLDDLGRRLGALERAGEPDQEG